MINSSSNVTRFQDNIPSSYLPVKGPVRETQALREIDLMWCLYNAWPNTSPRLEKTKQAAERINNRRRQFDILPPREAFQSTVDYYEAAIPLCMAKSHFTMYFQPDSYYRAVQRTLSTILPRLFY
jgi:hypothetical protein